MFEHPEPSANHRGLFAFQAAVATVRARAYHRNGLRLHATVASIVAAIGSMPSGHGLRHDGAPARRDISARDDGPCGSSGKTQ
jgi:hypothetical protein